MKEELLALVLTTEFRTSQSVWPQSATGESLKPINRGQCDDCTVDKCSGVVWRRTSPGLEVQFTEYGIWTLWSRPRFESSCEGSAEIAGSSAQSVMSSILKMV